MKPEHQTCHFRSSALWSRFFCVFIVFASSCALAQNSPAVSPQYSNVHVDALDGDAWNGLVFAARAFRQPSAFALRFGTLGETFVDGPAVYDAIREVGPHAPDASYCRISWQVPPRAALVTLEWSRVGETTVVGRISAAPDFQIFLETYVSGSAGTWAVPVVYSVTESRQAIIGERYFDQVFGPTSEFVVMVDQPTISRGTFPALDQLQATVKNASVLIDSHDSDPTRNAAGLEFLTSQTASKVRTAWNSL